MDTRQVEQSIRDFNNTLGDVTVPVQKQFDDLRKDIDILRAFQGGAQTQGDTTVEEYHTQVNIEQTTMAPVRTSAIAGEHIRKGKGVGQNTRTQKAYEWKATNPLFEYIGIAEANTDTGDKVTCTYIGTYDFSDSSLAAGKSVYIDSTGAVTQNVTTTAWGKIGTGKGDGEVNLLGILGFAATRGTNGTFDTLGVGTGTTAPTKMVEISGESTSTTTSPLIRLNMRSETNAAAKAGVQMGLAGSFKASVTWHGANHVADAWRADILSFITTTDMAFGSDYGAGYSEWMRIKNAGGIEYYTTIQMIGRKGIRFYETDGTHYTSIKAADTIAANVGWVLPNADATAANKAIISDAAGNLGWSQALGTTDEPTWQSVTASTLSTNCLIIDKTSGLGIKVDKAAPTFGWRDITGEITNAGGANKPTNATYRGGIDQFQFSAGDESIIRYHIPHDYVPGTDIYLHVHWSHISAIVTGGTLTFTAESTYAKGHNQAPFSAPVTGTFTGTASTTQYQHIVSETQYSAGTPAGLQLDTDDLEPDGVILVRLEMTTNNITSGGAVPDPFIHEVDVHYQSTNIGTKSNAPDFYT